MSELLGERKGKKTERERPESGRVAEREKQMEMQVQAQEREVVTRES